MTAVVAIQHASASTMITSNVDGAQLYQETGSTIMGLKPGMQLSLLDLLYGLLLPSGNDAAIAIAEGVAGSQPAFSTATSAAAPLRALDPRFDMYASTSASTGSQVTSRAPAGALRSAACGGRLSAVFVIAKGAVEQGAARGLLH